MSPAATKTTLVADPLADRIDPFGDALDRLDGFRSLDRDWDSYGAERVASDAVLALKSLIRRLRQPAYAGLGDRIRPFSIVPVPTGGAQIEWTGPGGALEVEARPDGS